ncbi:hypothetical protein ROG8370_00888 [Roseovarius gaetbuli]|uniref:DUF1523 domain-containing protein n=1 Tax=Roseovarius gaetbuli TaxID=1356575 RepID=A0A1X6YLL7_9RHOB|nr:DUF1523 family protein [Roseovarius gaetbuli]SLN24446.1 hypothetical protein ROG8370_00888 [Roseovarius gaetbuli]
MGYVKWTIRGLFWLLVIAFLHYTLPQHDVARITDTYEKRVSPGSNALFWSNADTGEATDVNVRDVFFIQAFRTDDKPMIYRNEDTGWGWPPYFKFDTSNLQAEASDLISKKNDAKPQWVVVRHYGWRNEFLSIYPNAVTIWAVDGPDVRIIPWVKIVLLTLLAALFWAIRVRWRRFRKQRIEPKVDEWTDGWA